MSIVNLIVALALMGGLWAITVRLLAASFRRTEAKLAAEAEHDAQVAPAAPNQAELANRLLLVPPARIRAPGDYPVADVSAIRDRSA